MFILEATIRFEQSINEQSYSVYFDHFLPLGKEHVQNAAIAHTERKGIKET